MKENTIKIYKVGGAIRDQLLGIAVHEVDWVVVGSTPEAMLAQGFQTVGKDFPVFLHPETKEEYALARTERKTAKGYQGFEFYADPSVTLEQDLLRRDLTINAIAEDDNGTLFDPYHGREDLDNKILRHVSPAFKEDPVRILRLARFAAKLPEFSIAEDTLKLMREMVGNGEVDALVAERVWKECARAMSETSAQRFFEVLHECGADAVLWPKLTIDYAALKQACTQSDSAAIRLAAAWHNTDVAVLKALVKRYRLPKEFSELVLITAEHQHAAMNANNAEELLSVIEKTDALRRPERWQDWLTALRACSPDFNSEQLEQALQAIHSVDIKAIQAQGLQGQAFAQELRKQRLQAISQ